MTRFRSASPLLLFLALAAFLFPLCAHGTCYEPLCCTYPPIQGTTHIESVSPQVALPGVTRAYIEGYCFGDSQGSGSITLNGEPMTDIVFWSDAEIEFIPPFGATSGNLVVTSQSYGSDSTALEANCVSNVNSNPNIEPDYCGNDEINATFTIAPVNKPVYWPDHLAGTEAAPQYVQGTWYYNDGSQTITFTLNQGPENTTNHTWPITGTDVTNYSPGQVYNVSGTLDQYGDLALYSPYPTGGSYCVEWLILGSGDVTSQGLGGAVACYPPTPPVPTEDFIDGGMDSAEGPYYYFGVPPLFKSQPDIPPGAPAASEGWATLSGSTLQTAVLWERTFPLLDSFVGYAGRFVYEQPDGTATDSCWYSGSKYLPYTSTLSGGGWFVDQSGDWGPDESGLPSQVDSFYQNYYGPQGQTCAVTGYQALYIDTRTGQAPYYNYNYDVNTQMPAEITPKDLIVGIGPGENGPTLEECEPYPGLKGKCK